MKRHSRASDLVELGLEDRGITGKEGFRICFRCPQITAERVEFVTAHRAKIQLLRKPHRFDLGGQLVDRNFRVVGRLYSLRHQLEDAVRWMLPERALELAWAADTLQYRLIFPGRN